MEPSEHVYQVAVQRRFVHQADFQSREWFTRLLCRVEVLLQEGKSHDGLGHTDRAELLFPLKYP